MKRISWIYWGGVLGAGAVILTSVAYGKNSLAGNMGARQAMEAAAEAGDYATAQGLMNKYTNGQMNNQVLGEESQLYELVYPEEVVKRQIGEQETLLKQYPGDRDVMLNLANLYRELGDEAQANAYWEQARLLDPNNLIFE